MCTVQEQRRRTQSEPQAMPGCRKTVQNLHTERRFTTGPLIFLSSTPRVKISPTPGRTRKAHAQHTQAQPHTNQANGPHSKALPRAHSRTRHRATAAASPTPPPALGRRLLRVLLLLSSVCWLDAGTRAPGRDGHARLVVAQRGVRRVDSRQASRSRGGARLSRRARGAQTEGRGLPQPRGGATPPCQRSPPRW